MDWTIISDWLTALGTRHGVDPAVFAILYFGGLPFIGLSVAWLVRNRRHGRAIHLPLFCATSLSASAYVYVIVAGENIPFWVYAILTATALYGLWILARTVRSIDTQ